MENIKKNRFGNIALLAASALLAVCSLFFPILLIAVPGFIAANVAKSVKTVRAVLTVSLIPLAAGFLLYGIGKDFLCVLPTFLMSFGSGLMIFFLQRKKTSGFDTVFYTAILIGSMLYLTITLPGLLSGQGAFATVREAAAIIAQAFKETFSALNEANGSQTDLSSFSYVFESLPETIVGAVVPCCCLIGGTLAFSNTLFFRLFVKKQATELGLAPLRPFSSWNVPRSYLFGTGILFAGSIALDLSQSEGADVVMFTAILLFVFPMMVQGLSFIDWVLSQGVDKTKIRKKKILFYILLALTLHFSIIILVVAGLFDQLVHFRERIIFVGHADGKGPHNPFKPGKRNAQPGDDTRDTDPDKDKTEDK